MRPLIYTLLILQLAATVDAFAPLAKPLHFTASPRSNNHMQLSAVAALQNFPNPFKKLPWNVQKERERQARRFKQERAKLHRQLGIAEDATYEEIVEATDRLMAANADDLKNKVKIEIAKDRILQLRLNERMAGLAQVDAEARMQSTFEIEGNDEDDIPKTQKEWNAPGWTSGLIVKPDEKHLKAQARLWGIITALGLVFPPSLDYLGRFTWLVCVAQLTFRGMPQSEQEMGGVGMSYTAGGVKGGSHRKVAFALGVTTWIVGSILVYSLMPSWAKNQRWTDSAAFTMQNMIFALVCSYLQPYKG